MTFKKFPTVTIFVLAAASGPISAQAGEETEIPLSQVPAHILRAAESALPGVELVEAETMNVDSGLIYELEGMKDNQEYEIQISEKGQLIEVKLDD